VNIKEYISSGVLESYVLGELSERARAEVEKSLSLHAELREELSIIETAHEALLQNLGVRPKPDLKRKIFDRIASAKEAKTIEMNGSSRNWKLIAAASVTIAIISSVLAYHYHGEWTSSQKDLTALRERTQRVAEDYNRVNQTLADFEKELQILHDPSFAKVVMNGTKNSPEALAFVYWNQSTSEVFLRVKNLKTLAAENQYQLWAIIDGQPVDAGVFDINLAEILKMKAIPKGAAAFAVTVEPRGGQKAPTLETVQVIGNVKSS
jgi:anti-sigma-K factor RskA